MPRLEIYEIEKARREKMQEVMKDYDRDVYYPALKAIRAKCKEEGHGAFRWDNNGIGWSFRICLSCGATVEKNGPDGEAIYE